MCKKWRQPTLLFPLPLLLQHFGSLGHCLQYQDGGQQLRQSYKTAPHNYILHDITTKLHINCTLKLHNIAATQPVWPDGTRCECRSCWRGSSLCLQLVETCWTLLQVAEYSIFKVSLNIVNLLEGTWYWSQSFRLRLPSLSVQTSSYPLWGGKNSQNIGQAEMAYHNLDHYSCVDWPSNLAKKTASPRYM